MEVRPPLSPPLPRTPSLALVAYDTPRRSVILAVGEMRLNCRQAEVQAVSVHRGYLS